MNFGAKCADIVCVFSDICWIMWKVTRNYPPLFKKKKKDKTKRVTLFIQTPVL